MQKKSLIKGRSMTKKALVATNKMGQLSGKPIGGLFTANANALRSPSSAASISTQASGNTAISGSRI